MDDTIITIKETTDMEYLAGIERFIYMSIENWHKRLKEAELNVSIKNLLIKESNLHSTPYDEYITNKSKYLLEVKEAYINRLIELKK